MKEIAIILIWLLPILPLSAVNKLQATHQNQQQEINIEVNDVLSLEEGEELLDYRYITENKLEAFTKSEDKYYRKFYDLKDGKAILVNHQEIERAKGGFKTAE